jgi:hypothetical protein
MKKWIAEEKGSQKWGLLAAFPVEDLFIDLGRVLREPDWRTHGPSDSERLHDAHILVPLNLKYLFVVPLNLK